MNTKTTGTGRGLELVPLKPKMQNEQADWAGGNVLFTEVCLGGGGSVYECTSPLQSMQAKSFGQNNHRFWCTVFVVMR
jgi:hypothetical protein